MSETQIAGALVRLEEKLERADERQGNFREEVLQRLTRLESKQDGVAVQVKKINGRVDSAEERLDSVDDKIARGKGWAAGFGAAAAIVIGIVRWIFGK